VPELVLASFRGGRRRTRSLELSGPSPVYLGVPREFAVNWLDGDGNVLLHFNPRPEQGVVVLNRLLDGQWGEEEAVASYPFPLEPDRPFHLRFELHRRRFEVSVDGRRLCAFDHRRSPNEVAEVRSTTYLWRLDRSNRTASPPAVPSDPVRAVPDGWVEVEENPSTPDRLESFRLFAVL